MHNINTGDTAFILIAAAMVLFMTPGLALFYGGMVRSKNVLGTIMQSFIIIAIINVLWVLFGYSLAFGPDFHGIIGDLSWAGLRGVGFAPSDYAPTIPHQAFMIFQAMFAIITPALITGAFAERMKFSSFLAFSIAWFIIVYLPVCHWIWGGGWLGNMGALDFAGGIVVHASSGAAALAAAIFAGKRRGFGSEPIIPHNLPLTIIGTGILWFGWFGFNAGSALSAGGGLATNAFVTTQIGATTATVAWVLVEWIKNGKPTTLGAATGAIAGLATITPAAGFVGPMAAIAIGAAAGIVCYYVVSMKFKLGYDDSLDVVGVHGAGGILGTLAIGIFASTAINEGGANGLLNGNAALLGTQAFAVFFVVAFSFVASLIIFKIIDILIGVRVSEDDELTGLDLTQHSEVGYELTGIGGGALTGSETFAANPSIE